MPWQSSATLLIIGGCFNAVAGLVGGIHYLAYGVSFLDLPPRLTTSTGTAARGLYTMIVEFIHTLAPCFPARSILMLDVHLSPSLYFIEAQDVGTLRKRIQIPPDEERRIV
jgi:hypothetical protein